MVPPSSASLSVRELTKRYGPVEAVRGVSFEIVSGEIFGLLGPNGAGKTSIIETLLGLRTADSGSIIRKQHRRTGASGRGPAPGWGPNFSLRRFRIK